MTNNTTPSAQVLTQALNQIWFTRCPVPTATGLAYKLGWLSEEFANDGITVSTLQDNREFGRHHYDHELPTLIREGGNLLALAARAQHAPTRLIGLTWIDEGQAIIVRPDSGITEPKHLKGVRAALPAFIEHQIPSHIRGSSIARGMSLQGFNGALALANLTLDDINFVEVESGRGGDRPVSGAATAESLHGLWSGLKHLADGTVDAVYVKGASAVDAAKAAGGVVGIDLDSFADRSTRVNNGTPRPITVHEDFLETHYDLVVRFLAQTLRAADWAASNLEGVRNILKSETRSGDDGVAAAYRDGFHLSLHPNLSDERLKLFHVQKKFMLLHGLLDRDFDLDAWADHRPLEDARKLLNERELATSALTV